MPGDDGPPGDDGLPGDDGVGPWLTEPGIELDITAASITDSTATADFTLTDASGTALDIDGLKTDAAVSVRFTLAYLDEDEDGTPVYWTAYTTREQTSPINNETATQAHTDSGGSIEVLDLAAGRYRYTFGTSIDVPDAALTHTVGAYATRTVDGTRRASADTFDFVPDGTTAVQQREVVTDAACNSCHGDLTAHGSQRRGVLFCLQCHSPQTTDPDTGNTVDFRVMVHKIHRGAELPSVQAGTPYQIIGFRQSVHDYSTVHFPQPVNNCETCHQGAQGEFWRTRPARDTCLSCHDTTSFVDPAPEGKVLHAGGAQPDDAPCNVCHPPTGSLAGITESHLEALFDPASPEFALEILDVSNAGPGSAPTVTFRTTVDGEPEDILSTPPNRLRATFAGPNTDYATYWQADVLSSGSLVAVDAADGRFAWTAPADAALPADASGSYTVGFEGRIRVEGVNFALDGPTAPFAVTGDVEARRTVVDPAKCNACHFDLAEHGGGRKNATYCALCHNANNPNDERSAQVEGEDIFIQSTDFRNMIHKIHAGENLEQPYVLGGFPVPNADNPQGNPIDFGETRYPAPLSYCGACHVDGTEELPLSPALLPSVTEVRTCIEDPTADANDFCEAPNWVVAETVLLPPTTSACTGCHDSPSSVAHAAVMTTPLGVESCASCHAPGATYDPARLGHGL